jgi:periplasmic protein TonB
MSSELNRNIDDLVFANRNKAYGAFDLRKMYGKRMTRGTLVGLSAFLLLIMTPVIYAKYQEWVTKQDDELMMREITLAEPPPIDPNKPEPPPPPKVDPPPIRDQIKFIPPVVKKDEEVVEEVPPPTQEDMKDKDPSDEDRKGDENGVPDQTFDAPPPPPPPPPPDEPVSEETFNTASVQQKPMFPDGDAALFKYLSENIKYPAVARDNGISGKVIVSFVVSKSGNIEDVQVVRGIGGGCDQEAERVVRGMPNWTPGKNNGKPVKVKYTLPVTFKLEG